MLVADGRRSYAARHHGRARDPHRIAVEDLCRRQARAQRGQLRRPARADFRPARPQRRGQVDPDQHPRRAGREDRRQGEHLGLRHRRASAQRQALDRRRPAGDHLRSLLHAARDARDPGRAVRQSRRRPEERRAARRDAPDRQGQRLCAHLVGRHEAAAAGRQGDGPFAADPGARRADRGGRRRASPPAVGLCPPAQRPGRHHRAHHPLSRGSRGTVRPDRDHPPRPGDRQ